MTRKSDYAFWTFVMLACLAGATTVLNVTRTYSATSTNSEIYKQLDLFGDVLERVRSDYVDKPDDAMLIDSALKQTGGKTDNKDALRAALQKADFRSLRGAFKFNTNHYPIQDFYLVKVAKRGDGKYQTEIVQKVFENYSDPHVKDCQMK